MCPRSLQGADVSDTSLLFDGMLLSPFLFRGIMLAAFKSLGFSKVLKEFSQMTFKKYAVILGISFSKLGQMSSGPGDLLKSRPSISFFTPYQVISKSGIKGSLMGFHFFQTQVDF